MSTPTVMLYYTAASVATISGMMYARRVALDHETHEDSYFQQRWMSSCRSTKTTKDDVHNELKIQLEKARERN